MRTWGFLYASVSNLLWYWAKCFTSLGFILSGLGQRIELAIFDSWKHQDEKSWQKNKLDFRLAQEESFSSNPVLNLGYISENLKIRWAELSLTVTFKAKLVLIIVPLLRALETLWEQNSLRWKTWPARVYFTVSSQASYLISLSLRRLICEMEIIIHVQVLCY